MLNERADDDGTGERPWVLEPIRPAASNLNYWVRDTHRRFAASFGRLLKETGIIASEWVALRALYRPQRWSPIALGVELRMSKGGASKLVSRLVAKRLAVKDTNDVDRRFRSVGLTRLGRQLVVFLAALEKDTDREFFGPLGNGRRFRLNEYIKPLLGSGRSQRMHEWVSMQLQQRDFQPFTPKARAEEAVKAQSEADGLWEYFRLVGEAVALGTPLPPTPESLR